MKVRYDENEAEKAQHALVCEHLSVSFSSNMAFPVRAMRISYTQRLYLRPTAHHSSFLLRLLITELTAQHVLLN